MKKKPNICIVIVNYNSQDFVIACIDNIKALNRNDLAFVVVDNSESPNCDRLSLLHDDVIVLRLEKNLGFGGGCNLGIQHGIDKRIPFILLLNPDTRTEQDFLEPLLAEMRKDSNLGMAGPRIVQDDEKRKLWQGVGKLNWWLGGPSHRWIRKLAYGEKPVLVPFLSGCAMLIKTEAIKNVGLMDEHYFLYFEDTDFSQAFWKHGWKVILVPSAEILHAASSIIGHNSEINIYFLSRNRILLLRRWAHWYQFVIFMVYNTLVKIPIVIILFGLLWRKPMLVRAYLRGYFHGLRGFSGKYI